MNWFWSVSACWCSSWNIVINVAAGPSLHLMPRENMTEIWRETENNQCHKMFPAGHKRCSGSLRIRHVNTLVKKAMMSGDTEESLCKSCVYPPLSSSLVLPVVLIGQKVSRWTCCRCSLRYGSLSVSDSLENVSKLFLGVTFSRLMSRPCRRRQLRPCFMHQAVAQ